MFNLKLSIMHKIYSFIQKAAKVTFAFGFCVMSAFALASCGDDDDDNNPSGGNGGNDSENTGGNTGGGSEVVAPSGLRPVSIGQYVFSYDSKNRCNEIGYDDEDEENNWVKIDYAKGTFSYTYSGDYGSGSYSKISHTGPCSFTKEGYIASLKLTVKEEEYEKEDNYRYTSNRNDSYTLSYDNEGHLKSVVCTIKGTVTENGQKFNVSGTMNFALTWVDGNLMRVEAKSVASYGNLKPTGTEVVTYTYGDEPNRFCQPTCATSYLFDYMGNFYEELALAGLLGKGSAKLPVSFDYISTEQGGLDGDYEDSGSETCRYELNPNGSIRKEYADYSDSNGCDYVYPGTDGKAVAGRTVYSERVKKAPRSFFSKHRFGVR